MQVEFEEHSLSEREEYSPPELIEYPPLTDVVGNLGTGLSDRNLKTNIASVEGQDILELLVDMPIASWNYKEDGPAIRHVGPMAQDFRAAFGLGKDDKSIYSIDANGVAFAAIQALYKLVQEKDAQIAELQERLDALEKGKEVQSNNHRFIE